jgi:Bacterial SH3 domain
MRPSLAQRSAAWLLAALLCGALPLAAAGTVPPAGGAVMSRAPQYAQPDPRSRVLVELPVGAALTVYRCFPRWCEVQAVRQGARGWVIRSSISVQGACVQLVPLGFKDVRRQEGGYRTELDLNRNGRACDPDDLHAEKLRSAAPALARGGRS